MSAQPGAQSVVAWRGLLLIALVAIAGCAAGPATVQRPGSDEAARVRLVAAIRSAPPTVSGDLNTIIPGTGALASLVSSGLTALNDDGTRVAQLAESVPSVENGLWLLHTDGRMDTTWRIRPGTTWQDGEPLTSGDLVFTARVRQDGDLPLFRNPGLSLVDGIDASDDRTIIVHWRQPFVDADALFDNAPLPAHLLEQPLAESKETFDQLPYWTEGFVGSGPFKVRAFQPGSGVILDAFDQYVLGKPGIGELEVRFIPDGSTLIASVLSGAVQITFGARNLSFEEAADVRDRWQEGAVVPNSRSVVFLFPQFVNPNPAILANVQLRRALLHAIDREEMTSSFQSGVDLVPHGFLSPDVAEYREVQSAVTRYDYDPSRAEQLIESLGYARAPDGFFRDAAGARIEPEVRTTTLSENQKVMLSVVDYWQRSGIAAEPHTIPQARAQEGEYRAAFPGFEIVRQGDGKSMLTNLHSSRARLPSNGFKVASGGANYPRYMNPELDALIDRYTTTIPWQDRMDVARQIIQLETDEVVLAGLIYSADANMVSNRVRNVSRSLWNVHSWTVR